MYHIFTYIVVLLRLGGKLMKKIVVSLLAVVLSLSIFSNTALASENTYVPSSTEAVTSSYYESPENLLEVGVMQENGDVITEEDLQDVEASNVPAVDDNGNIVEEVASEEDSEPSFSVMNVLWYQTLNLGKVGTSYGSWTTGVSGQGEATLSLSKSISVSNTYSGTLSASKKDVNAAVGFNISKSWDTRATYTVKIPKGKKIKIQYRKVYTKYKVLQKAYSGATHLGDKYVYPKKFSHLEYRSVTY
jgi:hypothetical protein